MGWLRVASCFHQSRARNPQVVRLPVAGRPGWAWAPKPPNPAGGPGPAQPPAALAFLKRVTAKSTQKRALGRGWADPGAAGGVSAPGPRGSVPDGGPRANHLLLSHAHTDKPPHAAGEHTRAHALLWARSDLQPAQRQLYRAPHRGRACQGRARTRPTVGQRRATRQ